MNAQEAMELGQRIAALVELGRVIQAYTLLAPVLAERTPFRLLDRIGGAVGAGPLAEVNAFLRRIAADKTEGGWVVIGAALQGQLERDAAGAFARSRDGIIAADVWYAADILGERVPGEALVRDFRPSLEHLLPWRDDENPWVRRAVGVAVHYWAKRSRGAPERAPEAETLLACLEPMFEERDIMVVKGISWGLKTLGRHYPDEVSDWLRVQVVERQRPHRAVLVRKALTYLSEEQRAHATGGAA